MSADQPKRLSRRQLLGAGAAAGIASLFRPTTGVVAAQQVASGPAAGTGEELVLVNGRIHTMDRNNAIVNSVTIRNGRFAAVGGANPRPGAGRRIIDLKGRTAVPGIIDITNIFWPWGIAPAYTTPLRTATQLPPFREVLAAQAR